MRSRVPQWIDRTLRQVCPACGEGRLFKGRLSMASECGECGLDFMGSDGAQYGGAAVLAYGMGGIAAILVLVVLLATGGLSRYTVWITAAVAISVVLASYRYCKALWTWILFQSGQLGAREGSSAI